MKKALIISDSVPGHFNQSIGICTLLSEEIEMEFSIVEMKWKVKVLRSLFKSAASTNSATWAHFQ